MQAHETYLLWKNHPLLDKELKEELINIIRSRDS
jgi:hypothetical protein